MGGLKFSVHPLFFLFGIYYALTGKILIFLIYTLSALAHEIGHSLCAERYGYRLNKIMLMPFGAVAKGNIDGLKLKDEIFIALAGPLVNFCIVIFFVAIWWIFPEVYAFTDTVVFANLSLALINLIPAKSLDGGRVLFALITLKAGDKKANLVVKILAVVFSIIFLGVFVFSILINKINFSALTFGLFILVCGLSKDRGNKYIKAYFSLSNTRLDRGAEVKTHAVSTNMTIKKLLSILDERAVNKVEVYHLGNLKATLSQAKINEIMEKGDLYKTVKDYV